VHGQVGPASPGEAAGKPLNTDPQCFLASLTP